MIMENEELKKLVSEFSAGDRLYEMISLQVFHTYEDKNYFLCFLGLSVLIDQAVRSYADMAEGSFEDALKKLVEKQYIAFDEANTLGFMIQLWRDVNNKYLYSSVIDISNGNEMIAYPLHEDGTWEMIVEDQITDIFLVLSKLKDRQ